MPFNVTEFASAGLKNGGARASLFEIYIKMPIISISGGADLVDLRFLCKAASIPASTVGQIEVPYFGRKIKYAGNRTYDNWTVTVMNDEDMKQRHAFEAWSQAINSGIGNRRDLNVFGEAGTSSYRTRAVVTHYNKVGTSSRQYVLENCFPLNISNIDLNWETTDAVEEYTVEFAYDYYTVSGSSGFGALEA
jgi:hypothetical protein